MWVEFEDCPYSQKGKNKCKRCGVYRSGWLVGMVLSAVRAQGSSSLVDRLRVRSGMAAANQARRQLDIDEESL